MLRMEGATFGFTTKSLKECPSQMRELFAKLRAFTWGAVLAPGPAPGYVRRQIADFYREIDDCVQMGKDFAGTNKCAKARCESMRAADIKEDPRAPAGDYNVDEEREDPMRQPMSIMRPHIRCDGSVGHVDLPGLETSNAIYLSDRDNA